MDKVELFAQLAGANPRLWSTLEGTRVTHKAFGEGTIVTVSRSTPEFFYFKIDFSTGLKKFNQDAFRGGFFSDISVPPQIAMQIDSLLSEEAERLREEEVALPQNDGQPG